MKKISSFLLVITLVLGCFSQVFATSTSSVVKPESLPIGAFGTVTKVDKDGFIEFEIPARGENKESAVVLKTSPETFIVDAVSGKKAQAPTVGQGIYAYYGPAMTRNLPPQANAVAIVVNIPQDFQAPKYAKVESLETIKDAVKVTTNAGSLIVTIDGKTSVSGFPDGKVSSISDIAVGSEMMLWYGAVATSFPGQATATQAVILNGSKKGETPEAPKEEKVKTSDLTLPKTDKYSKLAKGKLVEFSGTASKKFIDTLNANVTRVYDKTMADAVEAKSIDATFSYKKTEFDKYTSIEITAERFAGNTGSEEISTIVYSANDEKIYTLVDFLGKNAYAVSNDFVKAEIAKSSFATMSTPTSPRDGIFVDENTSFLIDEKGNIVFLYDKYEITSGNFGVIKFTLPFDVRLSAARGQMYIKDGVVMVPLRTVSDFYGYRLEWNQKTKTAMLSKGMMMFDVTAGSNNYSGIKLEKAPEMSGGRLFVPYSFFIKVTKDIK